MWGFFIGLLTLVMVLDCIVLVFLVLIQLPKKEAGAGLAFGGSASDALFGAGSGNVLTKITKYAATIFFVMALLLSILQSRYHGGRSSFQQKLTSPIAAPVAPVTPGTPAKGTAPLVIPPAPLATTNALTITPQPEATNTSAAGTNPAPPK
jgi:preprotein translocase subunit SecG